MHDAGCKIMDTRCKIQDTRDGIPQEEKSIYNHIFNFERDAIHIGIEKQN